MASNSKGKLLQNGEDEGGCKAGGGGGRHRFGVDWYARFHSLSRETTVPKVFAETDGEQQKREPNIEELAGAAAEYLRIYRYRDETVR